MKFTLIFIVLIQFNANAQNYLGLSTPIVDKGRFPINSGITQASGLAVDPDGISYWTHNDQGNPKNKIYKFVPTSANIDVILKDSVMLTGTTNYDWEDMTKDSDGNLYICQTGKNCTPNGDPFECPSRFVYKIHKVKFQDLNAGGVSDVTPETFYFVYPKTGYDLNNCMINDTVFVNSEATIWYNGQLYIFTKDIWSKNTNNCGGWVTGYTYLFKLNLVSGSTQANPLVAQYVNKFNLRLTGTEPSTHYQVTGAAISPDNSILALTTYGRMWNFRNFVGDQFFANTANYFDYSIDGINPTTRPYEGIEFKNNSVVTLCVDNVHGRISEIDVDQLTLCVTNTNDTGPGSLRTALVSATAGDTLKFAPNMIDSTIALSSGPLLVNQNISIIQPITNIVKILGDSSFNIFTIGNDISVNFTNINLYCTKSFANKGLINYGNLSLENVNIFSNSFDGNSLNNSGKITLTGNFNLLKN